MELCSGKQNQVPRQCFVLIVELLYFVYLYMLLYVNILNTNCQAVTGPVETTSEPKTPVS